MNAQINTDRALGYLKHTIAISDTCYHTSKTHNEPYPQLRHNAKMAKSVGAFCTESHWEETKNRP